MKLIVDNMSCAHCVKSITDAIKAIDHNAQVAINLNSREVEITNSAISQEAAINAINEAGFEFVGIGY